MRQEGQPGESTRRSHPDAVQPPHPLDLDGALIQLRDLLHGEPGRERWLQACALVDRCSSNDLTAVLDYIEGNTASWPQRYTTAEPATDSPAALRTLPLPWRQALLRGEDSEKLRLVRVLDLHDAQLKGRAAAALLASAHLSGVRYLDLSRNPLPTAFYRELVRSQLFAQLTHLNLSGLELLPQRAAAFAHAPRGGITELSIKAAHLRLDGLRAFLQGECWANLRVLRAARLRDESGGGLSALANALHIDKLELLDVSGCNLPSSSVEAFAARPGLDHLRELYLSHAGLSSKAVFALARAPWLEHLEVLDLAAAQLPSDASLGPLLMSPRLGGLRVLSVRADDGALEALCRNRAARPHALTLTETITLDALRALLASDLLKHTPRLYLQGPVPPNTLRRILRHPDAPNLQELSVAQDTLGPDELDLLLGDLRLSGLGRLHCGCSPTLTEEHARAVERAAHLHPQLQSQLASHIRYTIELDLHRSRNR